LARALVDDGEHVIIVDNLSTGHVRNLEHAVSSGRATFVYGDVAVPPDQLKAFLSDAIKGQRVDRIWHLASPASPEAYGQHPWETLAVNGIATMGLIDFALEQRARFLFTSTSEIYGDPLVHPQPESYWGNVNPIGPRGVYDEAKRFAEAITMAYHRYHNVDTRIVRIFNTYGPRMRPRDGRVVSNFIVQALNGEPITIYGDGSQTRSFCYVDDEIEGIYRLFHRGDANPTNIGNPVEYSVQQLAEIVVELTGTKSPIVKKPLPEDDPKVRQPDITRARTMLQWEPAVDVRDGIRRTIEYFSALRGTPRMAPAS
jgi:dTDP-glucose 4,6-dehydratase